MTVHSKIEVAEAEKMAAAGARILSRYHVGGQVFCDVEEADNGDSGQPPPPPPPAAEAAEDAPKPKKRGRPKKTATNG